MKAQQGMTLLEVMVALAIFASAVLALMNSISLGSGSSQRTAEAIKAGWVVQNQLLEQQKGDGVKAEKKGEILMGNQRYLWRKETAAAGDEQQIQLQVFNAGAPDEKLLTFSTLDNKEQPQ